MTIDLPTFTLAERRPRRDQSVWVTAEDSNSRLPAAFRRYEVPFLCRYVDGTWINAKSGTVLEINIVAWRPQHISDQLDKKRPGRLSLIEPRFQVRL